MVGEEEYKAENDGEVEQVKGVIACEWGARWGIESEEIEVEM